VHVSARDQGTGREQRIRIESSSGLSEEEIRRMVKDGEANASKDKAARERAEGRNRADSLLYAAEKSLRDLGDRADAAEARRAVESAAAELRAALETDDAKALAARTEALQQASHRLAEIIYQATGTDAGPGDAGGESPGGGERGHGGSKGRGAGAERTGGRRRGKAAATEDVDYEVVEDGGAD